MVEPPVYVIVVRGLKVTLMFELDITFKSLDGPLLGLEGIDPKR